MKISVIGAGETGKATAQALLSLEKRYSLDEIVVISRFPNRGLELDLKDAASVNGKRLKITSDYAATEGSRFVIVTAGAKRKEGMKRTDLIGVNEEIVKGVIGDTEKHSPQSVYIIVSNPIDVLAYLVICLVKDKKRVFGFGSELDGARARRLLSEELKTDMGDTRGVVLGEHGENMTLSVELSSVRGGSIRRMIEDGELTDERVESLNARIRNGGAEVIRGYGDGRSAYYAPGEAVAKTVASLLSGSGNGASYTVVGSVYLNGEYGLSDVCIGMPLNFDRMGVSVSPGMTFCDITMKWLKASAESVRSGMEKLKEAKYTL